MNKLKRRRTTLKMYVVLLPVSANRRCQHCDSSILSYGRRSLVRRRRRESEAELLPGNQETVNTCTFNIKVSQKFLLLRVFLRRQSHCSALFSSLCNYLLCKRLRIYKERMMFTVHEVQ